MMFKPMHFLASAALSIAAACGTAQAGFFTGSINAHFANPVLAGSVYGEGSYNNTSSARYSFHGSGTSAAVNWGTNSSGPGSSTLVFSPNQNVATSDNTEFSFGTVSFYNGTSTLESLIFGIDLILDFIPSGGGPAVDTLTLHVGIGTTFNGGDANANAYFISIPGLSNSFFSYEGFSGAGNVKLVSWGGGEWYNATLTPDGAGTFDLVGITQIDLNGADDGFGNLPGGPEGFTYVSEGNPGFAVNSMLVSDFSDGSVSAYEVDANGDPILSTRRSFVDGLDGAEGAVLDPLTGDFLFSTFGGGDRILLVSGFTELPPPPVPEPETYAMLLAGLSFLGFAARRRKQA